MNNSNLVFLWRVLVVVLCLIGMLLPVCKDCPSNTCDISIITTLTPCPDPDGLCIGSTWVWSHEMADGETNYYMATLTEIGEADDIMLYRTNHGGPCTRDEFLNQYTLWVPMD